MTRSILAVLHFTYCVVSEFDISDPDFLGENSYMCFTPVYVKQNIDIKLQIKPRVMDGVVFYVAKRLHSYSGDFLSLALQAGKIQLRYHLGDKLNVLANTFVMKTDGGIDTSFFSIVLKCFCGNICFISNRIRVSRRRDGKKLTEYNIPLNKNNFYLCNKHSLMRSHNLYLV